MAFSVRAAIDMLQNPNVTTEILIKNLTTTLNTTLNTFKEKIMNDPRDPAAPVLLTILLTISFFMFGGCNVIACLVQTTSPIHTQLNQLFRSKPCKAHISTSSSSDTRYFTTNWSKRAMGKINHLSGSKGQDLEDN